MNEDVGSEACDPVKAVAQIDRLVLFELLALGGIQDLLQHRLQVLGLQGFCIQRDELSLDPQERRTHRLQVEVGRLLLGHELE